MTPDRNCLILWWLTPAFELEQGLERSWWLVCKGCRDRWSVDHHFMFNVRRAPVVVGTLQPQAWESPTYLERSEDPADVGIREWMAAHRDCGGEDVRGEGRV